MRYRERVPYIVPKRQGVFTKMPYTNPRSPLYLTVQPTQLVMYHVPVTKSLRRIEPRRFRRFGDLQRFVDLSNMPRIFSLTHHQKPNYRK